VTAEPVAPRDSEAAAEAEASEPSAPNPVMPVPPDFPIEWPDPADERLTWEFDDMHMPFALPPLSIDYATILAGGFNPPSEEWGLPHRIWMRIFHGYGYFAYDAGVPPEEEAAANERRVAAYGDFADRLDAQWRDADLPEIRAIERRIREVDVDRLPSADLAAAWEDAWAGGARAWVIHFYTVRGAYHPTDVLADLYEQAFPGAAANEAVSLIQGGNSTLQEVAAATERLADLAQDLPAVRDRLLAAPPPTIADIEPLDGGPAFVAALGRFLDEHGHLGQAFDDIALPSWADEPSILLGELGQRLKHPPERATARAERLRRDAAGKVDEVRAKLADQPDTLAKFDAALALARAVGPLTEVHNYWIDRMILARLRTLAMRVGRRLVRESSMEREEDVLFLHVDEIADTIRRPRDRRPLVRERRAEHERQRALTPPRVLGRPINPDDYGRFDSVPREQGSAGELKGVGASAGVVRGPARVALGPHDFARIQPGDIIVCPASNPSWVPVFAIAGGLVTNTGGVLAHAAVVAREFGLPAVVGVTSATTLIADGREIEIDGTAGTVKLL
jgi:rifampicin phosphotransferase